MTMVTGRVRSTVRLRQDEVEAICVLATTWASDRAFPRTVGVGVPFEIETAAGQIYRVDPFQAVVALPVRRRERDGAVSREYAWVAPDDQVTVEGEVDYGGPSRLPPALHASRIAQLADASAAGTAVHHLPPRTLLPGEAEEEIPGRNAVPDDLTPPPLEITVAAIEAVATHEPTSSDPGQQPPPRRKKKKHNNPNPASGTPTPTPM